MLDLVAVLFLVRSLSARARKKGYPGYLAVLGVLGVVTGELVGLLGGARLGGGGAAILSSWACGALGGLVAFVIVRRLPDRSGLPIHELEETFR